VVGKLATRHGLNGQGIESPWHWCLPHRTRPALDSTQPSVQRVAGLFPESKAFGADLETNLGFRVDRPATKLHENNCRETEENRASLSQLIQRRQKVVIAVLRWQLTATYQSARGGYRRHGRSVSHFLASYLFTARNIINHLQLWRQLLMFMSSLLSEGPRDTTACTQSHFLSALRPQQWMRLTLYISLTFRVFNWLTPFLKQSNDS
jgi:hypothetical protein